MSEYPLQKIEKNELLRYFLQKPSFLSFEDENILIELIKSNKLDEFYDFASKLIKNTHDVVNLYVYLFNKLESQNIINKEIQNHVCWRLFNISSIGWLSVHDPEIINYCKKNTTDKNLLIELEKIEFVNWFEEYVFFVQLEKQIHSNIKDLDELVEKYFKFIDKLFKSKEIEQESYDEVIKHIQEETSIFKGKQIIGSLISESLQEKIGFDLIVTKLSIDKVNNTQSNTHLL